MISELAAESGVKVSTVRFYERRGLLPRPRRHRNGYRAYDLDDVRRVRFLRRGQCLGFTLDELADVVDLSDRARSGVVPNADLASRAVAKLDEIDARIADLTRMRSALADALATATIAPDHPCPVITSLAEAPG